MTNEEELARLTAQHRELLLGMRERQLEMKARHTYSGRMRLRDVAWLLGQSFVLGLCGGRIRALGGDIKVVVVDGHLVAEEES
jgi:hypothetical protein